MLLLPHWSVAVQVRAITLVAPQRLVTASLYPTVTEPQLSCAVATPVALVPVAVAGHSKTTLGGQMMVGGVVSRTVIVCTQAALLPQPSVAIQVRVIIFVPPQLLLTESL